MKTYVMEFRDEDIRDEPGHKIPTFSGTVCKGDPGNVHEDK